MRHTLLRALLLLMLMLLLLLLLLLLLAIFSVLLPFYGPLLQALIIALLFRRLYVWLLPPRLSGRATLAALDHRAGGADHRRAAVSAVDDRHRQPGDRNLRQAADGEWAQGLGLAAWGVLVIGLTDNPLRPLLVARDSPVPDWLVLATTLGGFALFGMSGFVIGPVVSAMFMTVWQLAVLDPSPEPWTASRRGMPRNRPAPNPPSNAPPHRIAGSGLDDRRGVAALRCVPLNRLRPSPCPTLPRAHEISPRMA